MPSPVKDRFVNSYEPIFVFSKLPSSSYIRRSAILKIPLEATKYKHTAVYPRKLVEALLKRVSKRETVLDPFAGTGTTAIASFSSPEVRKVFLIEYLEEFVEIIKQRLSNLSVNLHEKSANYIQYYYPRNIENYNLLNISDPCVQEDRFLSIKDNIFFSITRDKSEFKSALSWLTKHKDRFEDDSLFFLGIKEYDIESLVLPYSMLKKGFILRNMLIVENENAWFPLFMFVKDTKLIDYAYNFQRFIQPLIEKPKNPNYRIKIGIGTKVSDPISSRKGVLSKILQTYSDGFPKVIEVLWESQDRTFELVVAPDLENLINEELKFLCPVCTSILDEFYHKSRRIVCKSCGTELWNSLETIPLYSEPVLVDELFEELKIISSNLHQVPGQSYLFKDLRSNSNSKYIEIDRVNWGASPGARKKILGDSLTLTRLYKLPQPAFARFLKIICKHKKVGQKELLEVFGRNYRHTIGHWFREDFGGSLPKPRDLQKLIEILGYHPWFELVNKLVMKVQTVKPNTKGKLPEDLQSLYNIQKLFQSAEVSL